MSSRTGLALGLVALLAASGCTSFEMTRLRNDIEREIPEAGIGEGYAMSFGRFSMGTARTMLALAGDSDESTEMARALLRHVKKVQIGRYDVHRLGALHEVSTPRVFESYERKGWQRVVTVRDTDELVWVMAKEKQDDLRDLLVVVLSDEELIVAKMSGNLTRAVTAAMAESDWASDLARSLQTPADTVSVETTTTEVFSP